jgi:hypothetical protein
MTQQPLHDLTAVAITFTHQLQGLTGNLLSARKLKCFNWQLLLLLHSLAVPAVHHWPVTGCEGANLAPSPVLRTGPLWWSGLLTLHSCLFA